MIKRYQTTLISSEEHDNSISEIVQNYTGVVVQLKSLLKLEAEDHLKKKKLEAVDIIEKLIKVIDKYSSCPYSIHKDIEREIGLLKED